MLDLGTLRINVEVNDSKAKKELESLDGSIQDTSKSTGVLAGLGKKLVAAFALEKVISGVIKIGKAALQASADFEQLEGGVKKLFGDDAASIVMENANKAFATAGLSANAYMETVTGFSASLLKSMGGDAKAAAGVADMALRDMSDNANTFGTDMQSIQNAYQGFAKQNYTMLDNLKLGYGGTKTEMEKLLVDAGKLTGKKYDIQNLNDVYEAIHAIQEEQNIAGTTAKEASTTIEGSLNMLKASWTNVLTSLGTGEGLNTAISNLVSSIGTAAGNVLPAIGSIAKNLLDSVMDMIPGFFSGKAVSTVQSIVASILSYIPTFVSNLGNMISNIADNISSKNTGKMISTAFNLIVKCVTGIIKAIPKVLAAIVKLVASMVKAFFNTDWAEVGKKILTSLWDGLKSIWKSITNWVSDKVKWIKDKFTIDLGKNVKGGKLAGKGGGIPKRIGLREVPYDDYPALLHKGETILTAAETNQYKRYINGELPNQAAVVNNVPDNATFNLFIDGRKFAEVTAPYMSTQINTNAKRANRKLGVV